MRPTSSALACALLVPTFLGSVSCSAAGTGDAVARPPHLATMPAWIEASDDASIGTTIGTTAKTLPAPATSATGSWTTTSLGETGSPPKKTYSTRLIDLDVEGADLHDVCRLLAEVGKVNIVVADDVKGSVTLVLKRVPWDRALEVILRAKGYASERDGNIILVGTPEK